MRAAIEATKEITLAVLATTISLVIIFVPIAFMTGYAKRYVNQFGWTMAFSVMVSMLVSFTLTPMLSSLMLKQRRKRDAADSGKSAEDVREVHTSREVRFFAWLSRRYGSLMAWSLDHRLIVVLVALAVFGLSIPLNSLVGRDWIPADDQSEYTIQLDHPVGTSIDANIKLTSEIAERVSRL